MDAEQTPQKLVWKAGEADTVTFFYHQGNEAQTPVDVSAAQLDFQVKKKKSGEVILHKEDGDFDKSAGASGLASVVIQKDNTKDIPAGIYKGEIRAIFDPDNSIDKSVDIDFEVVAPVHEG